jgi:hypothetical protein
MIMDPALEEKHQAYLDFAEPEETSLYVSTP